MSCRSSERPNVRIYEMLKAQRLFPYSSAYIPSEFRQCGDTDTECNAKALERRLLGQQTNKKRRWVEGSRRAESLQSTLVITNQKSQTIRFAISRYSL